MNIVNVFADGQTEYNSSYWRGQIPGRSLRKAGYNVFSCHVDGWFHQTEAIKVACSKADLIIIQRVLVAESVDHVRQWRTHGKAIVTDFDDSYARLKPEDGNQASVFWYDGLVEIAHPMGIKYKKRLEVHPLQQFYEGGAICTGYTMPSRVLVEDYKWVAPCWYVPNWMDTPRYLSAKRKQLPNRNSEIVIGWGGSMSHINSFKRSGVAEALRRVLLKRKNVKVMICGDERIVPLLPLPKERIIFQPYVMWDTWPRVLSSTDIGIAPLQGRYDHSRSALKPLEFSLMGIPFVATGCPAYTDWMERDIGLYVQDGEIEDAPKRAEEWEKCLIDIIDRYDYHKQKIDSQFEYPLSWDIDTNIPNLIQIYEEIINR